VKKKRVVDIVEEILTPYVSQNDIELVDVEFVKEGPYRYLRITIDKEEPVTLDDCQWVSQYLSKRLDALDPIEEQYFLEVTSPGVERLLKRDSEYEKFKGRKIQIKLFQPYEGQKMLVGTLAGLVDDKIAIEGADGIRMEIPKSKVATAKLVVDFDELDEEGIEEEEQ